MKGCRSQPQVECHTQQSEPCRDTRYPSASWPLATSRATTIRSGSWASQPLLGPQNHPQRASGANPEEPWHPWPSTPKLHSLGLSLGWVSMTQGPGNTSHTHGASPWRPAPPRTLRPLWLISTWESWYTSHHAHPEHPAQCRCSSLAAALDRMRALPPTGCAAASPSRHPLHFPRRSLGALATGRRVQD